VSWNARNAGTIPEFKLEACDLAAIGDKTRGHCSRNWRALLCRVR